MKKLDKFDDTIVGQTIWGSLQMIAENIALNKTESKYLGHCDRKVPECCDSQD